ncbi:MAG: MerR family DNA-binding transcriptional regulator [Desulfobulbaceae bacterium]|nr:MerR family DNA-binding transcriptional regulator [Desulfobulbaceae bacterium]
MLTISKLAKRFGLSRATILYYEREGLLDPAGRATSNEQRTMDWHHDRCRHEQR